VWDTHGYTNMWHVPGYDYLNFASEDTRICAPSYRSLKRFFAPADLWPEGYSSLWKHGDIYPWPDTWTKYTSSIGWKKTGPFEHYYDPQNAAENVYRLGMAEAEYYRDTIERQRRGRPAEEQSERRACGGYIVWKYNESWPQIYSAKLDYWGEPYLPFYAIKRAYEPLMLSIDVDTYVWLWVVNDTTRPVEGTATVRLVDPVSGEVPRQASCPVQVGPGQSKALVRLDQAGIGMFRREHVIFAELRDGAGKVIARTNQLGDIERKVTFPPAKLDVRVEGDALVMTTDQFAHAVELTGDANGDDFGWLFEDNWFDLLPGERKVVRILGQHTQGRVTAKPWYSPHATVVDWRR
jgi:beta-mannosidase